MAENELHVGEPRLCHLIDGDPDTPEAVVMLQNTGDAITATFPISGMASLQRGPYDRWWFRDIEYADDLDRAKYSYSPPPVLMVYDDAGPVVLVGCRATGGARQTFSAGKGVILADFAVLGGRNLKYGEINGMRTTSPAYRKWSGGSVIEIIQETDDTGRLESLTLTLHQVESMKVAQRLNLSARQNWSSTPALDGYDVRESLTFQTLVKRPRSWLEHLDPHIDILDLISIAAWKNCAFQKISVNREDDPAKGPHGTVGERWSNVVSHRLPGDDLTDCDGHFLFSYGDMNKGGINRWLRLRKDYGRALDYLLRILRSGHTWSPQSAVMSGIALEQLGYLIEMKRGSGSRLNERGGLSFKNALDVILGDMKTLPINQDEVEDWKDRCRNLYMGAKHGDRQEVDHLTMLNTLRENLLVLRYWIAGRLGVSSKALDCNLPWDPLRSRFISEEST